MTKIHKFVLFHEDIERLIRTVHNIPDSEGVWIVDGPKQRDMERERAERARFDPPATWEPGDRSWRSQKELNEWNERYHRHCQRTAP